MSCREKYRKSYFLNLEESYPNPGKAKPNKMKENSLQVISRKSSAGNWGIQDLIQKSCSLKYLFSIKLIGVVNDLILRL